jgi:UDP-2-acetamido-3-amino-2,3-dideoxy-glucuronate N-acetyltransferase
MIHPLADVQTEKIGKDTKIWQFCIVLKDAIIGSGCNINCNVLIENQVVIGDDVTIKPGVCIWDGITIEDKVMIGPNVTFTNDKRPRSKNRDYIMEKTLIKRGASIGAGAIILCGLEIGEYAMIGAGALVTKSVPDRALCYGVPAKVMGWLNEDGTKMTYTDGVYIDNKGNHWIEKNNKLIEI